MADRLSNYNDNTGSQTYQYDANGNRTSHTIGGTSYLYTTALTSNRLLSVQGPIAKTYSYDAAGNIAGDGTTVLTWNAAGRLAKAVTGAQSNKYNHNGLGERVIKSGSGLSSGPYRFIYDSAGHLVGEYDKNSALRQETVWLGDLPVAVVKKDAATQQWLVYYIQADHLNAPRVILNNAHIPVWRWDTADAFGNTLPNEDPDGDGKKFEYNLRFPGQYYDKETGLHYNYFREYDPKTDKYYSSDPIGLAGGLNTYIYVSGNPVNFTDPFGLTPQGTANGAAIGTGVVVVVSTVVDAATGGLNVIATPTEIAVGAAIGGVIGDAISNAMAGSNSSSASDSAGSSNGKQCPDDNDDDECEKQLQREEFLCEAIAGPRYFGNSKKAAFKRYSECRKGIPESMRSPLTGVDTPI